MSVSVRNKVDLVMWTKNGAATLRPVMKRINEVIPSSSVNRRIVVDDGSTDGTVEIARSFGWAVVPNAGSGISDGANTALRQVESDFFVSFEQDLVLAEDWWLKIPRHFNNPRVGIASGVRLPDRPQVILKIQKFTLERNERKATEKETFLYGKTLDNTIYRTSLIRSLGGFPKLKISAGVDNVLALRAHESGFEWKVDYSVRSIHLRKSLRDELSHEYWYGTCFSALNPILFKQNVQLKPMFLRAFFSPLRGLEIAVKKRAPEAIYVYPLMRFSVLKGISDGMKAS